MNNSPLELVSSEEIVAEMHRILASPYQNWLSTMGKQKAFERYRDELFRRSYSGNIPVWQYTKHR